MAYYCGKLSDKGSSSLSGKYGFVTIQQSSENDKFFQVTGRYGKKYGAFLNETTSGSWIGEKIFPRTALRIVVSADQKVHVWLKSFGSNKRTSSPSRRTYQPQARRSYTNARRAPSRRYSNYRQPMTYRARY